MEASLQLLYDEIVSVSSRSLKKKPLLGLFQNNEAATQCHC